MKTPCLCANVVLFGKPVAYIHHAVALIIAKLSIIYKLKTAATVTFGVFMQAEKASCRQVLNIGQTRTIYAIPYWGGGYFDINEAGHVCVRPEGHGGREVDLFELIQALQTKDMAFPVLVRFIDILQDRVHALQKAFARACGQHAYQGRYTPVYPIKVNQQKSVVEGVLAAGGIGLEVGSKAELLAALGWQTEQPIVCNGYKDKAYIRYALIGLQMGLDIYIFIEKPSELDWVVEQARDLDVQLKLGVHVRLSSIIAGKWQNSGGEKAKFGLHADEVLKLLDKLERLDLLQNLQLMHFHMGSQVANIHDIKTALQEAARFFVQLRRFGAAVAVVDVGGGLGIDYDGSQSRHDCSMNYSLEEYAENIIACFSRVCRQHRLSPPDIITESGRAITAHHAVLITNVIDVERVCEEQDETELKANVLESYHDAVFALTEARSRFIQDKLDLAGLAEAEKQHIALCQRIKMELDQTIYAHRQILEELEEKLADKIFCNFSMFQSMPDVWGIGQIFPIMPVARLDELPQRRAVIQDLTCDSDGRIDCYIDRQNNTRTQAVHDIKPSEPYWIGFFSVGRLSGNIGRYA